MFVVLFISLTILSFITCITVFNFFTAPMIKNRLALNRTPPVSVLIPARNEQHNISHCLEGLLNQDYPNFDIYVIDDNSEDETAAIIKKYAQRENRVHYIAGEPLPPEWTGKNWACHQLGRAAAGDILIFTDADNRHAPFALSNTIAFIDKYKLGMISAFPQQKTVSFSEKLIVPIMDLFVYGSLPLWATYYVPFPSLAAANGQWIGFTREAYNKLGGHESVKDQLVEDTELSRIAKKRGIRILTTAGTGAVYCRMYQNMSEIWQGFSKNFYGLTGYNTLVFIFIILFMLIGFVSPYFLWIVPNLRYIAIAAIGMNLLLRFLISVKYKHPLLISVILHPVGILFAIMIGINSFMSIKRGRIIWKGRECQLRG